MQGSGGFHGRMSASQMRSISDGESKMLNKMTKDGLFADNYKQNVDIEKVNFDVMKPWIKKKVIEIMGFEDDIVIEYVQAQLTFEKQEAHEKIEPKKLQMNLTPFLGKKTASFCHELWDLLLSAQSESTGIPRKFVDEKKQELEQKKLRAAQIGMQLAAGAGSVPGPQVQPQVPHPQMVANPYNPHGPPQQPLPGAMPQYAAPPGPMLPGPMPGPGPQQQYAAGPPHSGMVMAHAAYPGGQPQMQPGQMQPGQMQPGQMQPGQMQPGQMQPGQIHPGQMQQGPYAAAPQQPGMVGAQPTPGALVPGYPGLGAQQHPGYPQQAPPQQHYVGAAGVTAPQPQQPGAGGPQVPVPGGTHQQQTKGKGGFRSNPDNPNNIPVGGAGLGGRGDGTPSGRERSPRREKQSKWD